MQKIICAECECKYWIGNWASEKRCPNCGGTGEKKGLPCTECGKPIPPTNHQYPRKTCGPVCALARNARLARESREKRGLKRQAYIASPERETSLDAPLTKKRKCHDCGTETWDYRCPQCRAIWRAKNGADGLNGVADLFTAGRCYAEVGA